MNNDTINKVLREICDMQAENYGNGIDTHIDLIALCARGREALATSAASERSGKLADERAATQPAFGHPDDFAVERFAAAMKIKMAECRAKGRSGWDNEALCGADSLRTMLNDHVAKGDPVDVGNFAMMLFNRNERTEAAEQRYLRAGKWLHAYAKGLGWMDDGEGALEFVVRFVTDLAAPISEATEADSSSAAPSELERVTKERDTLLAERQASYDIAMQLATKGRASLAAPSPTRESLNEKPCVGCNGAGVIGTPGMPCPFCPVEKKLREFEAALATPRQPEDGSGLSAAIMSIRPDYSPTESYIDGFTHARNKAAALVSTFTPKEPAAQGGVPEAEPVAWIRKTDITELTDSEPETNGWTALYAAPTGASHGE